MNITKSKNEQMWESLHDPELRKQLIDEHINVGIAFQIHGLRKRQDLRQIDMARLLDVKQPLISAWENPNYGNYSLNTLKDMAKAFDVGLLVRFVPFSTLVNWTLNVTPNVIAPPNFNEEQKNRELLDNIQPQLFPVDFNPTTDTKDIDIDTYKHSLNIPSPSTVEMEYAYVT